MRALRWRRAIWIACACGLLAAAMRPAQAAYACTVTSAGWNANYDQWNAATNVTPASLTITCTRGAGDAANMNYTVAVNNGTHAQGQQNRAFLGAGANAQTRINYEQYRNGTCGNLWAAGGANRLSGSINIPVAGVPAVLNVNYWGCIPGSQTPKNAGTYTDTNTMTLRRGGAVLDTGQFPVSITVPAVCTFQTPPGTLAFTYTAFGPVQNASTPFGVRCSNALPYTFSLDATVGVVGGLQYSLSLSAPGGNGNALVQNYQVNGTMPAGQAGTCAAATCPGLTQQRTLTITY